MQRTILPYRADHVGSLLRPPALLAAREEHRAGKLTAEALGRLEDAAIRDAVKLQEDIGLRAVTDGEFRRTLWHADFLTGFANVVKTRSGVTSHFHSEEGDTERELSAFCVVGRLARPHPIFVHHFRFLKSVATVTPKQTIPSPSILHFRGGRYAIDRAAYPDLALFYADLARVYREEIADLDAGCRYLQIDEVNLAYLCDPALREQVRTIGEDPNALPHTYAALINAVIDARPRDMVPPCICAAAIPKALGWPRAATSRWPRGCSTRSRSTVFPRVRHSARGRLRAAALRGEGQDRGARSGHDQASRARKQGRAQTSDRRGRALRAAGAACLVAAMRLRQRRARQQADGGGGDRQAAAYRRGGARGVGVTVAYRDLLGEANSLPSSPRTRPRRRQSAMSWTMMFSRSSAVRPKRGQASTRTALAGVSSDGSS